MPTASWGGTILAETDEYEVVEGNIYFPPGSVNMEYFSESDKHTHCPWKGDASYYNVTVDGELNPNAAWYYPETFEKADHIKGYVAFWNGVEVNE